MRIGPFALLEPLGVGGMGEVWRARHEEQGVDVAIKLVLATRHGERELAAFRNEVRAVAQLRHPGVIDIFDHGVIEESLAEEGPFAANSPWLAMELASGGSLATIDRALSWREMSAVLQALLDALGHAHAHGLVHRDIKPGNVLLCTRDDIRPGLKLTDFGIAHAMTDPGEAEDVVTGTLQYMPPEQLAATWRDHGPWTDLYSVGCLAWKLSCGRHAFGGRSAAQTIHAHFFEGPPPLRPRTPVPEGFEAWIGRLMTKNRYRRFQRAADAHHALRALGEVEVTPTTGLLSLVQANLFATPAGDLHTRPMHPLDLGVDTSDEGERPPSAPIPATWRRPLPPPPPASLAGVGLGLFGLRPPPLAGRENERDVLWSGLRACVQHEQAGIFAIRGPSGIGKSRLAEWISLRAHEVGAATVLPCRFSPGDGPTDAVQRMVSGFFGCTGLPREEARERVEDWLEEHGGALPGEADALTELILPGGPVPLEGEQGRHAVLVRLIERMTRERPVIVWLDDVQWGADGLGLAWRLRRVRAPILVLAVANDEVLADRPLESHRLEVLLASHASSSLELGPLDQLEAAQLVRELLGLEPGLAARVEMLSTGSPLFAIQLVADWVHRGVLVVGPHGFQLAPGETLEVPDDIRGVWTGYVDRLIEGLPGAQDSLWRAAVLGMEVDFGEWTALCDDPSGARHAISTEGIRTRSILLDRLLAMRLAAETDAGWRFAHGMLRESLLSDAADAGMRAQLHGLAASLLRRRGASAERVAHHLLEAGHLEEAFDPLLEAVNDRQYTAGARPAIALLATLQEILETRQVPPSDPRSIRAQVLKGTLFCSDGAFAEAAPILRQAADLARDAGEDALRVTALFFLSTALFNSNRFSEASLLALEEFRSLAVSLDDPVATGKYWYTIATRSSASLDSKDQDLRRAMAALERAQDHRGVAATLRALAMNASIRGDDIQSLALHQQALAVFEDLGMRHLIAECHNGFGESHRRMGALELAEADYRRALAEWRAVGSADAVFAVANLGILAALRKDWPTALRKLEEGRQLAARHGREETEATLRTCLLAPLAATSQWEAWDEAFLAASQLDRHHQADPDAAELTRLAAIEARRHGQEARAQRALAFSIRQWTWIGREDEAEATRALLQP